MSVVKSGVTWPPHGGHVLQYMVTFAVATWSSSFFEFLVQGSGPGLFLSADNVAGAAEASVSVMMFLRHDSPLHQELEKEGLEPNTIPITHQTHFTSLQRGSLGSVYGLHGQS